MTGFDNNRVKHLFWSFNQHLCARACMWIIFLSIKHIRLVDPNLLTGPCNFGSNNILNEAAKAKSIGFRMP